MILTQLQLEYLWLLNEWHELVELPLGVGALIRHPVGPLGVLDLLHKHIFEIRIQGLQIDLAIALQNHDFLQLLLKGCHQSLFHVTPWPSLTKRLYIEVTINVLIDFGLPLICVSKYYEIIISNVYQMWCSYDVMWLSGMRGLLLRLV